VAAREQATFLARLAHVLRYCALLSDPQVPGSVPVPGAPMIGADAPARSSGGDGSSGSPVSGSGFGRTGADRLGEASVRPPLVSGLRSHGHGPGSAAGTGALGRDDRDPAGGLVLAAEPLELADRELDAMSREDRRRAGRGGELVAAARRRTALPGTAPQQPATLPAATSAPGQRATGAGTMPSCRTFG
jgi:hypothetical protein